MAGWGREEQGRREGGSRGLILERQPIETPGASDRLTVESSRLPCDDGQSASCPASAAKNLAGRGVHGWPASGLDTASSMRQDGHGGGRKTIVAKFRFVGNKCRVHPCAIR